MLVNYSLYNATSFADHVFEGSDGQLYEIRRIGNKIHILGGGGYYKILPGRVYKYSIGRGCITLRNKVRLDWRFHLVPDDVVYRSDVRDADCVGFNAERKIALMTAIPQSMLVCVSFDGGADCRRQFVSGLIGANADALLVSTLTSVGIVVSDALTNEVVYTIKPFLFGLNSVWFAYPISRDTTVLAGSSKNGSPCTAIVKSNSIAFKYCAPSFSATSSNNRAIIYAHDDDWKRFIIYADLKMDSFCVLKGVREAAIISQGLAVKPYIMSAWHIIDQDELNGLKVGYIELSPIGQSPVHIVQFPSSNLPYSVEASYDVY